MVNPLRVSGQRVQVALSDQVAIDQLARDPELYKKYAEHVMVRRDYLPEQQEFVAYLKSQTSVKELSSKIDVKKSTIEHWFRKDQSGFSYPSIEDWEIIKPYLKEIKFDKELTTITNIEWQGKRR